jgi:polar amino acid transport system substrate-binding protein
MPTEFRRVLQTFLVATLLICDAGNPSNASPARPIVIAFDAWSVPTQYVNSAGEVAGIYPGIVRRAFEIIGQPVTITALPFRRVVGELFSNRSGAGALARTPSRGAYCDFSVDYYSEAVSVYALTASAHHFSSAEDLRNKSVGVIAGWAYGEPFDTFLATGSVHAEIVESDILNFRKLNAGRIDFALATSLSGRQLTRLPEFSGIRSFPVDLARVGIHLAFNKASDRRALLARFDEAIARMRRDGELAAIVVRETQRASTSYPLRSR